MATKHSIKQSAKVERQENGGSVPSDNGRANTYFGAGDYLVTDGNSTHVIPAAVYDSLYESEEVDSEADRSEPDTQQEQTDPGAGFGSI